VGFEAHSVGSFHELSRGFRQRPIERALRVGPF
jgi:hypothetical protein